MRVLDLRQLDSSWSFIMGSRVSSRRRLLREIARGFVLLGSAAAMAGIFIYFVDWSAVRRDATARPQSTAGKNDNGDQLYTGAILVPTRGALCWEGLFDNRTGRMTDKGDVNCAEASHAGKNPPQGMDAVRLRTIGKAFHRDND
jgi:hypothetical protein